MVYHLCLGRTDVRKGINSLIEVGNEQMGRDMRNGEGFIFIGSSGRLMKLIHAEDGGMVMYVKRLEAGHFKIPAYDPHGRSYGMEWRDLVVMFEGITTDGATRLRQFRGELREYHVYAKNVCF